MGPFKGSKIDGPPTWAGAPWTSACQSAEPRHEVNWFDSSWDLRRGLDVAELHDWPADLDGFFPRLRLAEAA